MKQACISHYLRGGASKSLLILLQQLPSRFESRVFAQWYHEPNSFQRAGIPIVPLRSRPLPLRLLGVPAPTLGTYIRWACRLIYLADTVRQIQQTKPDIVILNGLTNLHYAPFFKNSGIVLFAREIACDSSLDKHLVTFLINRFVNHVICISEHERDALSGVRRPISVIHNPNDREIPSQLHVRRRSVGDAVKVGIFGQIYEPKGQYLLVEAMASYKQCFDEANIRFLIFGENLPGQRKNLDELSRLTQQLNCQHIVAFPGWADDPHEVMQELDIVLRTDLTGSPWGRDVIEAMSHGLPVIASGQSEVFIKHGQTGRLFPPGNVEAMVRHILDLAKNPQERERYGTRALEFARQHFSPSLHAQRVASILDSVAKHRARV